MKTLFTAAFAILLSFTFTANAQTKKELQDMYQKYLTKRDIESTVDEDGDVQFKMDGLTYFIEVNEDDPMYFRLVLANIWPIESEEERAQVYQACNDATANVKVCKVYAVPNDNVWISFENFIEKAKDFDYVFDRALGTIELCKDKFVDTMRSF